MWIRLSVLKEYRSCEGKTMRALIGPASEWADWAVGLMDNAGGED